MGEIAKINPKSAIPEMFEYVDLDSVVGTEMLSHRSENKKTAPSRAQRLAQKGDLFYQTVRPYQKNNYLFEKAENNYVFSTGYAQLRPYCDSYFLLCLVQNEKFVKVVLDNCTGTSYPAINATDLSNIKVVISQSIDEQEKIGLCFKSLDTLITLHQRKCIITKDISIFAWEQRKLGDVFAEYSEKGQEELQPLTIIQGQGTVLRSKSERNLQYNIESLKNYKLVYKGDFILHLRSFEGGLEVANLTGIVSPAYHIFHGENTDSRFYYLFFRSHCFINILLKPYVYGIRDGKSIDVEGMKKIKIPVPSFNEQKAIGTYLESLDTLITLHQRKCRITKDISIFAWEQRKLGDIAERVTRKNQNLISNLPLTISAQYGLIDQIKFFDKRVASKDLSGYYLVNKGEFAYNKSTSADAPWGAIKRLDRYENGVLSTLYIVFKIVDEEKTNSDYLLAYYDTKLWHKGIHEIATEGARNHGLLNIAPDDFFSTVLILPKSIEEQKQIGVYFNYLDSLITLHQREYIFMKNAPVFTYKGHKLVKKIKQNEKNNKKAEKHNHLKSLFLICIYILWILTSNILEKTANEIFTTKEITIMAELESTIEEKLIEQLVYGDSQWNYRKDLKTEEDLWKNFKYILEQNNKDRLNGERLSDAEFEQVKNQLQFSSFYKAGEWLVGENGKVQVHVQRNTEKLHLVVMNHEHIAGGSSVYEVINQYRALRTEEDITASPRDRRFDVTLMINGLPMIHIELKNKEHSYMDGFWQIKKYIGEGKFTGIFSAVQMFVVSNGVDTKYFSAASDKDLNPKFMSRWLDKENNPVANYIEFAKCVLRIPEAHEMIAKYTVLDEEKKSLILLRPYQIHAIEAIREASKKGESGFVWHTTGSGKTLTSYKATRNLLMDIPSIDKTIFLIDRKDLDAQTTMAFQAYANNDLIDVDETDNVNDLKKKLKSGDRQVIVTTIQKLQILISKRLKGDTPEYNKIRNLKVAFVVDECHRAVTPKTKRDIEKFFGRSLWFGFTGTPRFAENPYPQMGDLPRTTEDLYGKLLHKYTIQNAIHDNAVLAFQVEHDGPKDLPDETDKTVYESKNHMLQVLNVILNKSYYKLGFQNGKGKTYCALLTTSSIQMAQKYYDLLTDVKKGKTSLTIDEKVKQVLPDFPKFAITYSISENEEGSHVNQEKMQASLADYNNMFGTKYDISQIQSYNGNLNKRLARKDAKYESRSEQLDLVIVVDRLLTGFDAPCMSTIFIDRQPMGPHDLIQAFSRTNRIFDPQKTYGQIVTFQAPKLFKKCVDDAVKLYSAGGTKEALAAEWDEVETAFRKANAALRVSAPTPAEIPAMSIKEKTIFASAFQMFDKLFAQLKSFTNYDDSMLADYNITQEEYDDYAGHYFNVMEELKADKPEKEDDVKEVNSDYELMAYSNTKIDYEYIINLIQNIVNADEEQEITPQERQKKFDEIKSFIKELRDNNPKIADIMTELVYDIELNEEKYRGQSISNIVENIKKECIDKVVNEFCDYWCANKADIMYAAYNYRSGVIPNENVIKDKADYAKYKERQEKSLPKFKYYSQMIKALREVLEEEIKPLIIY